MSLLLKGKFAVVTGCNRGIGKAILEGFANNGANIWACVRKPDDGFEDFVASLVKKTSVKEKILQLLQSERGQLSFYYGKRTCFNLFK